MSERAMYQKFKKKMEEMDPYCFCYKIPDTGSLGGKKPFDLFLITKGIPFAIEFKSTKGKVTKYQNFMLEKFKNADGIGTIIFEHNNMDDCIKSILAIRDLKKERR